MTPTTSVSGFLVPRPSLSQTFLSQGSLFLAHTHAYAILITSLFFEFFFGFLDFQLSRLS